MKKFILIPIFLLLLTSLALAASVNRDVSSRVLPGAQTTITLKMSGIQSNDKPMAIEDTLPASVTLIDWNIIGSSQAKDEIEFRQEGSRIDWAFIPSGTTATISYTVKFTNEQKDYTFGPLVWFDRSGMSPANAGLATVKVTTEPAPTTTVPQVTTTTTIAPKVIDEPVKKSTSSNTWIYILVFGLLVIGIIAFFMMKKEGKI